MEFLNLTEENKVITRKLFKKVADKGEYLMGTYLKKLEDEFPKSVGYKYGIAFKNATDALTILMKKLIREYPRIVCPNFTAYPPAIAARSITKKVYYADVDHSLTLDVNDLPDVKKSIVLAVNMYGNNADLQALREYCRETKSILIEDCAQSTGSEQGFRGDFAIYSFYPTKPLGSMGDGGMICFNDESWIEYFKLARFYGQDKEGVKILGVNSRMDEWQCAIVLEKMKHYRKWNDTRIKIAERYKLHVQGIKVNDFCVYHRFPVLYNLRDEVIKKINFPYLISPAAHTTDMEVLKGKRNKVNFRVSDKIIQLPIHSQMTEDEICEVEEFLHKTASYEN